MMILAIETSCDETAAAVVSKNPKEDFVEVLSNVVASSLSLHAKTGGIIPNIAAREQLKYIIPVIEKALYSTPGVDTQNPWGLIDATAVTYGPGLIGSLLIGVETAKTLGYLWKKPIIPVNHLLGHIYANFIQTPKLNAKRYTLDANIKFPALALLVSGGHTDLVLIKNHNNFKWLGGTLDDAAGEAFDKIGRLLNLPYPAGPVIETLAQNGDEKAFTFPRPMIGSKDFNFSFSGLKAAAWREVNRLKKGVAKEERTSEATELACLTGVAGVLAAGPRLKKEIIADICASVQKSIVEVLVRKTLRAAKQYKVRSILLGGGVACNQKLRDELKLQIENCKLKIELFYPEKSLCTDNAAMIGAYAAFHPEFVDWKKLTANPELYFS